MMEKSDEFILREISPKTKCTVLKGFHILPTFLRLHLHLITDDFGSPGMNSKYAWGSFTTGFFMHPEIAISMLQREGKIEIDTVEACDMRGDNCSLLSCHGCEESFTSFSRLKTHIPLHDKDIVEEKGAKG